MCPNHNLNVENFQRIYSVASTPAQQFLDLAMQKYGLSMSMEACAGECRVPCIVFASITLVHTTHPFSLSECPPKWKLAVDVLAEIKQDFRSTARSSTASPSPLSMADTSGRVLFIVKDSLALAQLRDVLVTGIASVCDQRYRWFVSQQAADIRSRVYKQHRQQTQKRWSGSKRAAEGASGSGSGGGSKQQRVSEPGSSAADNRTLFLYPKDADLLGGPADDAGT